MRYFIQIAAMLGDIIIWGTVALLWRDLGKDGPVFCLLMTLITFRIWRSTGGFIAWTPKGIRAFMTNAKKCGL